MRCSLCVHSSSSTKHTLSVDVNNGDSIDTIGDDFSIFIVMNDDDNGSKYGAPFAALGSYGFYWKTYYPNSNHYIGNYGNESQLSDYDSSKVDNYNQWWNSGEPKWYVSFGQTQIYELEVSYGTTISTYVDGKNIFKKHLTMWRCSKFTHCLNVKKIKILQKLQLNFLKI